MERKYFGTDGIRGTANEFPMTAEIAFKVGQAAGQLLRKRSPHARPSVVIGKDTRISGYMVEAALQAGFTSVGFYCLLAGPLPTPAVAYLTRSLRADLGVMISASHNPFTDNGIKLFGADGFKLPDEVELQLEALMDSPKEIKLAPADKIGKAVRIEDAEGRYIESCKSAVPKDFTLDGLRVVIDCANGAAYKVAPKALWELGAQVIRMNCDPDGVNINRKCGATDTEAMRQSVLNHGADIGIALDGDADRIIISDEKGNIIDGDQIMASITSYMADKGKLKGGGLVATMMSNMGLEKFLNEKDIKLERTKVGDRYVVEEMRKSGYNFGGEASGHLIMLDYATTGDGLLAGLKFLEAMRDTGKPASQLGKSFKPFPQKLENVRLENISLANQVLEADCVGEAITKSEETLNGKGRVVIRKSGTEPLIRVMVEAENTEMVDAEVLAITTSIQECVTSL